jgi:hypothetical protein
MADYLTFPFYTNACWVLLTFTASLLIFHALWVWFGKLTAIQWKKIDYAWVALALLGVVATVDQTRVLVARNLVSASEARLPSALAAVKSAAGFGTSGAVCRTFVRSTYSPLEPQFSEIQQSFDAQCAWFKDLLPKVLSLTVEEAQKVNVLELAPARPVGGEDYAYRSLDESVIRLSEAYSELETLRRKTSKSWFHEFILVFGPFLLAIAIALRLTKVSGEVDIERRGRTGANNCSTQPCPKRP